jgi:type IV pilus assembly protein PilV
VSVLVLSLGIFGMVGLQLRALKGNNSSFQRTQAVMMSYYIIDAMKVDVANAKALSYNTGEGSLETDDEIPPVQRGRWMPRAWWGQPDRLDQGIKAALGTGCQQLWRRVLHRARRVPVQVRWDDTKAGGLGKQIVQTVTKL